MAKLFLTFLIWLLLLVLFGMISTDAWAADPINIRVIYVRGGGNIPRAQAQRISAQNAAYYASKLGRKFVVRSFRIVRPFPIRTNLKNSAGLLESCEAYNINLRSDIYSIKHCIFPPVIDKGAAWIVGWADGVCCRGCQSISSAMEKNPYTGLNRVAHSLVAQRHEWGHILGAPDEGNDCTLMWTGVLSCVDSNQYEISSEALDHMRKCTKKWKNSVRPVFNPF